MNLYVFIVLGLLSVAVTFILNKKTVARPHKSNRYVPYLQTKVALVTKPKLKKRSSVRDIKSYKESLYEKGKTFEAFVARRFDPNYFSFKDARSDLCIDGAYPESNMYPDLLFECKWGSQEKLAIECKFRQDWYINKNNTKCIKWSYENQIERYKGFGESENARVFVVIGIGGLPESPREIFIVPLNFIDKKQDYLPQNFLRKFQSSNPNCKFFYDMSSKFLTQKKIA